MRSGTMPQGLFYEGARIWATVPRDKSAAPVYTAGVVTPGALLAAVRLFDEPAVRPYKHAAYLSWERLVTKPGLPVLAMDRSVVEIFPTQGLLGTFLVRTSVNATAATYTALADHESVNAFLEADPAADRAIKHVWDTLVVVAEREWPEWREAGMAEALGISNRYVEPTSIEPAFILGNNNVGEA